MNSLKLNEEKNHSHGLSIYNLQIHINHFLLNADINSSSKITYKRGLNKFLLWIKNKYNSEILLLDRNSILSYKEYLLNSEIKPYTKSLYLVCLRQFFTWCESCLIYPNIAKGVKGIKRTTRSHHKDSLTKEQIITFIKSINQNTLSGKRDYALVFLLLHTGLRLIEASNILIEDIEINIKTPSVVWVRGKGRDGKDNFVVLVPEVIEVLEDYIKARGGRGILENDSYLFVSHGPRTAKNKSPKKLCTISLSRIIKNRLKYAKIKTKRISAHSLRHTFGVMAIQGGASLYELQLAMRHSSSNTTQVYLGDIEKIKRLEASPEFKVRNMLKEE